MSDTVRIVIGYDHETGTHTYHRTDSPAGRYTFGIPADQYAAWETARLAWDDITQTLTVMYGTRETKLYYERETERLRDRAEKARAEYDEHLKHAREHDEETSEAL